MDQVKLESLLNGFTGDEKHDIDYFLKICGEYDKNAEKMDIINILLEQLIKNMTRETRILFFTELKENGLGHLIKYEPVELHSLSDEEVVMVKKVILGQIKVKQVPIGFSKAIDFGGQLTISVPKEIMEKLKREN